jgi:hypothetical protein
VYEGGSVEITVMDYSPESEGEIVTYLENNGFVCSVDSGVITAEHNGAHCYQAEAEDWARDVVGIDDDCRDDEGDYECRVEVAVERLEGETYIFDAGDFEPGGECYRSDETPASDLDDLLDEWSN